MGRELGAVPGLRAARHRLQGSQPTAPLRAGAPKGEAQRGLDGSPVPAGRTKAELTSPGPAGAGCPLSPRPRGGQLSSPVATVLVGLSPPGDRPQAGGYVTSLGTTSYRVYLFEVTPVLGKGEFHCVIVFLI